MDVQTFLNMLPGNGWKTVIGAVGLILFGLGGLVTGKLDTGTAVGFILGGWTALGIRHGIIKSSQQ
jgi:hypothetical protein